MRSARVLNWVMLCVNFLLFGLLSLSWFFSAGGFEMEPVARWSAGNLEVLNMDLHWAKGPFALWVSKDSKHFPHDRTSVFVQRDQEGRYLVFMLEDTIEDCGAQRKEISLWHEGTPATTIGCSLFSENSQRFIDSSVTRTVDNDRSETFWDWGADGTYDKLHVRDLRERESTAYVYYQESWQEVETHISQDRQILLDGVEVVFVRDVGKWLPATDVNFQEVP